MVSSYLLFKASILAKHNGHLWFMSWNKNNMATGQELIHEYFDQLLHKNGWTECVANSDLSFVGRIQWGLFFIWWNLG